MINSNRGECTLTINGQQFTARVTLDTIKRIENLTGKSFFHLVKALGSPEELTVGVLVGVVELSLKSGPDSKRMPPSEDIFGDGLLALIHSVSTVVQAAMGNVPTSEAQAQ